MIFCCMNSAEEGARLGAMQGKRMGVWWSGIPGECLIVRHEISRRSICVLRGWKYYYIESTTDTTGGAACWSDIKLGWSKGCTGFVYVYFHCWERTLGLHIVWISIEASIIKSIFFELIGCSWGMFVAVRVMFIRYFECFFKWSYHT